MLNGNGSVDTSTHRLPARNAAEGPRERVGVRVVAVIPLGKPSPQGRLVLSPLPRG